MKEDGQSQDLPIQVENVLCFRTFLNDTDDQKFCEVIPSKSYSCSWHLVKPFFSKNG